ncbi:MAG: zf-HC2 domain-containing protein [Candidatus Omnitrophica bacterium]|nr:zf-HC2 domain-containing protein [Candidatus Omnitrophota bacterium]
MNCYKAKRLLSRYIDNELKDESLRLKLHEHLKACEDCQREFHSLIAVKRLIAQKEKIKLTKDFLETLKLNIQNEQAQIIKIRWLPEAGNLARKLIPVPAIIAAFMFFMVVARLNGVNPVEEYLYADLSDEDIGILSGYVDSSELLTEVIF